MTLNADVAAKLQKLIEHGRKSAWDPANDVDWTAGSNRLEQLSGEEREALRSVLSLVYYSDAQGTQILSSLCRALDKSPVVNFAVGERAHEFFIQQMDDEARHASGIRMLLTRLGLELEPKALSHLLYSKFLLAEGFYDAKLIMIYWYIEILAKGIFVELKARFPETAIDSLFTRIIRDEARHVGFGEVYIPARLTEINAARTPMALAYYSSAAALPGLYRFSHYAKAARVLGLDIRVMFEQGMQEIAQKARRLPGTAGFIDLRKPAGWAASLL